MQTETRFGLDEVGSMSELGIQFARAYGEAPEVMLYAALSEMSDEMISAMMRDDIPAPHIEEAVEEFVDAAASEWRRISASVRSLTPGQA